MVSPSQVSINKWIIAVILMAYLILAYSSISLLPTPEEEKHQFNSAMFNHPTGKRMAISSSFRTEPTKYHYVISTGCSIGQDWQSYAFFYHARTAVRIAETSNAHVQVTRVASGCSSDRGPALKKIFQEQIAPLAPGLFHLHLTPDFSNTIPGKNYMFFNKPYGIRHWLHEALGFPHGTSDLMDTIFVLLDPDQLLTRPFEADMTHYNAQPYWKWITPPSTPESVKVSHGKPFGQKYGMGPHWVSQIKKDIPRILQALPDPAERANSQLHLLEVADADRFYNAGPPYLATGHDFYTIVNTWANFAVPVYELTKDHLSEMFAYSVASAHLGLKHQLAASFMVSDYHSEYQQEGWAWVADSQTSRGEVCASRSDRTVVALNALLKPNIFIPPVLHYCQAYALGPYSFYKHQMPDNFMTCQHPLIQEPPANFAELHQSGLPKWQSKRLAFFICHMFRMLNEALEYWKVHHCGTDEANFEKSFVPQR